ncbi:UNVERIFIED_CONTAM: hypothetical protein FKN15_019770 [Acipenser sinensis]
MGNNDDEKNSQACQLFENFVQASTCKGTLQAFNILCRQLELDPQDYNSFYTALKSKVTFWKAKALWSKLDKRASHKEYQKGKACPGTRCLIIGGGPCGLRTAIELAFLGAKVVVIEKRDTFSRNNVLHLWPYTIHDLRGLGAKKFYGKFCAGAIDHISIRQLQLMLVKVALIVGVEFHVNVEFVKLLEPPEDQENQGTGWRAEIRPMDHPVSDFEFDVVVGADGRRNTLEGFRRKEFRGKLAIAITANFINRNTTAEAKVEEISGVAFIFNQKFFLDLKEETGIDLENIVYYRDNTHYFVMTAKKQSLLDKGVIIHDYIDTEMLLSSENMNQEALLSYAREAADFGTNYQLPSLDFAINHYGQPDVAMFDFTSMHASENAALIRERHGHQLLVALVGDSLLEPFWPMGTGCARGFLAAFDTVWMVRSWIQGRAPLEILAERESIYRLLPQTTPENITKNFDQYTIDPVTRYPNLNCNCVRPLQVRHLYITGELQLCPLERVSSVRRSVNLSRRESEIRPNRLLTWCQKQTESYKNVHVSDLTTSWRSGLALCALIHHFRPDLLDFDCLNEEDVAKNNQLAFDMVEREFGIPPVTTGKEMVADSEPDKLSMVMYLSKFYELFRGTPLPAAANLRREIGNSNEVSSAKSANPLYNLTLPRKRTPKDDKKVEENDATSKRRRKGFNHLEEASNFSSQSSGSEGREAKDGGNQNKVKSMASQLLAKFEENAPSSSLQRKFQSPANAQHVVNRTSQPLHCAEYIPRKPKQADKTDMQAESTGLSASRRSTVLAVSGMLQRLQRLEDQINQTAQPAPSSLHPGAKAVSTCPSLDSSAAASLKSHVKPPSPKLAPQMTVGKVSSVIGSVAEVLVTLYENDHRPNPRSTSPVLGYLRKEFPQTLGGSDSCHFCTKRVYVMERLSAEGRFFHRECFRCDSCNTILRMGIYAFDTEEGKFYCKTHFAQRKTNNKHRKRRTELQKSTHRDLAMASSPQKSPSTPKSPTGTPKSPPSRKKDDSFLGKLGGTLARRKKAKEVSELQEEGINAINLPLSPIPFELDPEDTMLEENEVRTMVDPNSRNDPRLQELMKVLIDWINDVLVGERIIVKDVSEDLYDGQVLQKLFAVHAKSLVAILHLLVALSQHFRAPIRLPDHVSIQVVVVQKREGILQSRQVQEEITGNTEALSGRHERDAFDTLFDHAPDKLNVVKKKREGILQSRQVQEEITGNTEYVSIIVTLITFVNKHLNKLNLEVTELDTQTLITFVNKHLNKLNLEVTELDTQFADGVYLVLIMGLLEDYFVPLYNFFLTPEHFEQKFADGVYLVLIMGLLEDYFVPLYNFFLTPEHFEQKVHNVSFSFELMQDGGLEKPKPRPEDIVNCDLKSTLRVLYNLFTKYRNVE